MDPELQWAVLFIIWSFWFFAWMREDEKIEDDIYYQGKERTKNKIPNPFLPIPILYILSILSPILIWIALYLAYWLFKTYGKY